MSEIKVKITITNNELNAIWFFQSETQGKLEASSCEKYFESYTKHANHFHALCEKLKARKSLASKVHVTEEEIEAIEDFRGETADILEGTFNAEYKQDFERHDHFFSRLKKKYKKARGKATIKRALEIAAQRKLR